MTFYKKKEFENWLSNNRNTQNPKKYLGYIPSFRKNFLQVQTKDLDCLLENLDNALAYDKKKTVELLRLYVRLAEKAINSPSLAIKNGDKSLKQHLGIFKSYVDFIEDKCSEKKRPSRWAQNFKEIKQFVLQLLEHKIVLTHDELVDKFVKALATQDRFSYRRPDHLLYPARIYDSIFIRKKFKDVFMVSGVQGMGLDEMKVIISDRGESIPLRAVKSIEIKTNTGEVTVNLQIFTRMAGSTPPNQFEPLKAEDASQLSIDHVEPQEQIMRRKSTQWPEMEKVSSIVEQTKAYKNSKTDIKGITNEAKPIVQRSVDNGSINKNDLYKELQDMAQSMLFELMDTDQNREKSNK